MARTKPFTDDVRINWYRCQIDKESLRELTRRSDLRAFLQVIPQLALFVATTWLALHSYHHWPWYVTVATVFLHGTFAGFLGMAGPGHELSHRTPFKTRSLNEFFIRIFCFLSWSNFVIFRVSHTKHHAVTVHEDYDGEVVLPAKLKASSWLYALTCNPLAPINAIRNNWKLARGKIEGEWLTFLFPEGDTQSRREIANWSRMVLAGHALLAVLFISLGAWFLIPLVSFGWMFAGWLAMLVGFPQHAGLSPNVNDFRLSCRTFMLNPIARFFYWNMNYHIEHHMYAAVPFYNLPRLRRLIEHDLPPANDGILATWREILAILRRQKTDPDYVHIPALPNPPAVREREPALEPVTQSR